MTTTCAHAHSSTDSDQESLRGRRIALSLVLIVCAVLLPVIAVLWPADSQTQPDEQQPRYLTAEIIEHSFDDCEMVTDEVPCGQAQAQITGSNRTVDLLLYRSAYFSGLATGDRAVLQVSSSTTESSSVYSFVSLERSVPLVSLTVIAAVIVGLIIGARGLRAMISLLAAGAFIWFFLISGITAGGSALLYTAVSALFLLTGVLFFTHGLRLMTVAAWLGTLTGLSAAIGVGWLSSTWLGLGPPDEATASLTRTLPQIELFSLAIAALVLVLIGVLNDIAAAQAATVFSHQRQSDELTKSARQQILRASLTVGRDHASSAIYTVVFSIIGGGLAALMLAQTMQMPLGVVLGTEAVAVALVQALSGIIGTVVTMPATTLFALLLRQRVTRVSSDRSAIAD